MVQEGKPIHWKPSHVSMIKSEDKQNVFIEVYLLIFSPVQRKDALSLIVHCNLEKTLTSTDWNVSSNCAADAEIC